MPVARLALILVLAGTLAAAQAPTAFTKANRDRIIASIFAEVSRQTGGTIAMSDSGSGKPTSDMDVTGKMALHRPDGSIDNDLTPHFLAAAKKLYGSAGNDFAPDEHGAIRSTKLDTAVHDAKNAVPDFRSALPPEAFKVKFMAAVQSKALNPDAYFTAGGNKKQVEQRMQTKSRLRVFRPNGGTEEVTIDSTKPDEYAAAMKKYFDMNPDEVTARSHQRDLFGDAFDAYRQAREPGHESDPQNIRGDPKYNTRIINNYLEMHGMPPNWSVLTGTEKQMIMQRLLPDDAQAAGRAKMIQVLDASFNIYTNRDLAGMSVVGDQSDVHAFSEMFQRNAIAAMAERRLPDLLNPNVTLQDLKDHAQAMAQADKKPWSDLTKEERLKYLQAARQEKPALTEKLKFAAAGELAMTFKSLDGMDSARAARLKQQILDKVRPEQRPFVQTQIDLAMAYLRDTSNAGHNAGDALAKSKKALAAAQGQLDSTYLAEARKQKEGSSSIRQLLKSGAVTKQAYDKMQEGWANLKAKLDPSMQAMAGTLDKMDKAQSVLNLIKVYQDSGGDPDAMKRAVYMEAMSRYVPGYDTVQMYKMWKSGDPAAQEQVQKSLVFQGLSMLPGGAIARGMKLGVDVAKTGLDVTIGYELNAMGDDTVRAALSGGTFDSILRGVPGANVEAQRKNLYQSWKTDLGLEVAFRRLDAQRKVWNNLLPYEKAYKPNQDSHLKVMRLFYETVNRRITAKVDDYLAGTTRGGEIATGAKDKLIRLLFADFVNGLNRELGDSLTKGLEREAAASESVLDEVDNYLFGLFSKSLDVALNALADDDKTPPAPGRWDLRFDVAASDKDTASEQTVVSSAVQVIPPLNPTFEERNTTYELFMPGGDELQNQIVNGRVKFRLRHPRTKAIVIEKDFVLDVQNEGLVFREYWDAEKKILKREYQYFLEPGHVGGPAQIRHGWERVYFSSGKISYSATRKNNALDGPMTRYWENGQVFDVAAYKGGSREGPYSAFYSDGKPRAVGQFIGDRKVGAWKTYHGSGTLESEGGYPAAFYTVEPVGMGIPVGSQTDKGLYYNWGPKEGKWTVYYFSGRKQWERVFADNSPTKDGKLIGPHREYFDNDANSLQWEALPVGGTTRWHPNGQMQEKCPDNGPCRRWKEDGTEIK